MFRNWGFLMTEMMMLIIFAALLGLLAGWLIWGRRSAVTIKDDGEATALRRDLQACHAAQKEKDARIAALEADVAAQRASGAGHGAAGTAIASAGAVMTSRSDAMDATHGEPENMGAAATAMSSADDDRMKSAGGRTDDDRAVMQAAAATTPGDAGDRDYDGDGVIEGTNEGVKPKTLDAARDGGPDDLKQIKGIGPKLEQLCHRLGFYHFDQVANWSDQEVAWVDANLEGFRGRVSRDKWVEQAKILAAGGETEFSKRVEDGDVY